MATAQQYQVAERGWAALRPVTHVMALSDPYMTAREAAAPVPMEQRASQRRRNRARPDPYFQQPALVIVLHDDPARVAGQAPRRFRGNVAPFFQHGLAGLLAIR